MKLKYYLRGLGIGIVVTAIIMTVALGNKQPMTDEEVVARAKELGMIENTVLTDIGSKDKNKETEQGEIQEPEEENGEDIQAEPEKQPDNTTDKETDDATDKETENATDKETVSEPEKEQTTTQKDVVTITVVGGDSSWTVAKRMEEAGLIESAKDFDAHLCRYGYDKKISVGTYDIPTTATHEEMAKIITKTD